MEANYLLLHSSLIVEWDGVGRLFSPKALASSP